MPDSIILKLKSLGDSHTLDEMRSLISDDEIYLAENKEDPDTLTDAIDFIINNL